MYLISIFQTTNNNGKVNFACQQKMQTLGNVLAKIHSSVRAWIFIHALTMKIHGERYHYKYYLTG